MNRCKYCKKELTKSQSGGFYVCDCEKGKKDWKINVDIQMLNRQLKIEYKKLKDLKDEGDELK